MITVSSGSITIQALISPAAAVSGLQGCVPRTAASPAPGIATPNAKPPVAVSAVTTNWRRESEACECCELRMMALRSQVFMSDPAPISKHDQRRTNGHHEQNECRGHEDGEAEHDDVDRRLHEAVS